MTNICELDSFLLERADGGIALAFSGGVDSSLLLEVLRRLRVKRGFALMAMTMHSRFQRADELECVREATGRAGVELRLFECDPLEIPGVADNPVDRCYRCKRHIFSLFRRAAAGSGIATLIDGTNADDRLTYRPGIRALRELGVVSPLAELGIAKSGVRAMAAELGLECATRPAAPCLATRFEYGTRLTPELIGRVAAGEALISGLMPEAVPFRLRVHGATARLEVPPEFITAAAGFHVEVAAGLRALGFEFVTLDLDGFRSGSMDIGLAGHEKSAEKHRED